MESRPAIETAHRSLHVAGESEGANDPKLVRELQDRVAVRIANKQAHFDTLDPESRRLATRDLVVQELDTWVAHLASKGLAAPPVEAEEQLVDAVVAALGGLGRLEPLLARTDVEDIFWLGCEPTILRLGDGTKVEGPRLGETDQEVTQLFEQQAARRTDGASREFSAGQPLLNLRLRAVGELGARLSAAREVTHRPAGTIRIHRYVDADLDKLHELGMIDSPMRAFLRAAVLAGLKIFISGGTGMGKTMLLRALCAEIPLDQMIVTIEDEQELGLHLLKERDAHGDVVTDANGKPRTRRHPALVRAYEAREANSEGAGAVTIHDLVKKSLRDSPDIVILGESRGAEMVQVLEAMTNGIAGIMSTLHADSAQGVFNRIVQMVRLATPPLPADYALSAASSLDLIIQVHRNREHERFVTEIVEVHRANSADGIPDTTHLFAAREDGRAVPVRRPSPAMMANLAQVGFSPEWMDKSQSDWDRTIRRSVS